MVEGTGRENGAIIGQRGKVDRHYHTCASASPPVVEAMSPLVICSLFKPGEELERKY